MVNTTEKEYRCAYKEVSIIIEYLEDEIKSKIPEEKIEFYKKNMDKNHEFEINTEKELDDQNILYQTRCILANLFIDYIASEEDRAEILKEEREELKQIEEEKRRKYNPNDIFDSKNKEVKENTKNKVSQIKAEEIFTNTEMIVKGEKLSWFIKIKNKIISFVEKILKR